MTEQDRGDSIQVGNITQAQGVAIGRGARASVTGHNVAQGAQLDPTALRSALQELFAALGQTGLPADKAIGTQTAVGKALEGVQDDQVQADTVVPNLERAGELLKQAKVAVDEGSSLWESVMKLGAVLGPAVGGARVVAGWFGIPIP